VALVDHKFPDAALDVNVTLPPAQNVVGPPAVIVGVAGKALTIIVLVVEFVQPLPSVKLYVMTWLPAPAVDGLNNPVAFTPGPL